MTRCEDTAVGISRLYVSSEDITRRSRWHPADKCHHGIEDDNVIYTVATENFKPYRGGS